MRSSKLSIQGLFVLIVCSTLGVSLGTLNGQSAPETVRACVNEQNVGLKLKNCSSAIGSQKLSGGDLGFVFAHRAFAHMQKGDYDRAIQDYDQAITLRPSAALYHARGNLHGVKGAYDRALLDYDKSLQLEPHSSEVFLIRGTTYALKGDYATAIPDYDQALRLKPTLQGFMNRGFAHLMTGAYERAIQDYDRVLQTDPNHNDALIERGLTNATRHEYDRAIKDYDTALRLKPTALAYGHRGDAYREKGDYGRALQDYDESIQMDAGVAETFYARGTSYTKKGDAQRALLDFDEAIRLDPEHARALEARGNTHEATADLAQALRDYTGALRIAPQNSELQLRRAMLLFATEQFAQAEVEFQGVRDVLDRKVRVKNLKSEYAIAETYVDLWLYLSRARGAKPAVFTQREHSLEPKSSLSALVSFYSGKTREAETVLLSAQGQDRCEAHFFVAEHALLGGNAKGAAEQFQRAVGICAISHPYHAVAQAELKRLVPVKPK